MKYVSCFATLIAIWLLSGVEEGAIGSGWYIVSLVIVFALAGLSILAGRTESAKFVEVNKCERNKPDKTENIERDGRRAAANRGQNRQDRQQRFAGLQS